MIHDATNHPDESYLEGMYPKNILSDMPKWIKENLASRESQRQHMERLAHDIVSDTFLSNQFLKKIKTFLKMALIIITTHMMNNLLTIISNTIQKKMRLNITIPKLKKNFRP